MTRQSHRKPNLLRAWRRISQRIRRARRIVLFLDFDGTLSEHRARPEDAVISPTMRRILLRLASQQNMKIRVISGRRYADVIAKVQVRRIQYFGLHGWERTPVRALRPEISKRMRQLSHTLESVLPLGRDFWLEDKQFTLALHFRAVPRDRFRTLRLALRKILDGFGRGFWVLENKREWEILPREIKGKGYAVKSLFRRNGLRSGTLAIFVGDDTSDESAFRILRSGITVRVGHSSPTFARFRLNGPSQVLQFLNNLAEELP
jgi:trehalose-phosphatase